MRFLKFLLCFPFALGFAIGHAIFIFIMTLVLFYRIATSPDYERYL